MPWILVAVAVIIFGLAALAATGKFGEMPEAGDDTYAPTLPERPLTSEDLRAVTFGVQLRGYDMAQVDELLSRLAAQLDSDSGQREVNCEEISSAVAAPASPTCVIETPSQIEISETIDTSGRGAAECLAGIASSASLGARAQDEE